MNKPIPRRRLRLLESGLASIPRRMLLMVLVPVLLVAMGTLAYHFIEGWTYFDALYMTVITLTTVGYGETHPLSTAGRAFTICLMLGGVFAIFFATMELLRAVVSGEVQGALGRHYMGRTLAQMRDHMIVCGFGRMGRFVCHEFSTMGLPFVVIERSADLLADFPIPHGIPLQGDATSDETLKRAGIQHARALVSVLSSDADNLYITMSARLLNDKVFIVARAEEAGADQKLERAGANRVVSPYLIGGVRVAQAVTRPTVVDFIELATRSEHFELQIEEMKIGENSPLAGTTVQDSGVRQDLGVIIVAIKKMSGHMVFNPKPNVALEPGDILIAIGDRKRLDELEALANSDGTRTRD